MVKFNSRTQIVQKYDNFLSKCFQSQRSSYYMEENFSRNNFYSYNNEEQTIFSNTSPIQQAAALSKFILQVSELCVILISKQIAIKLFMAAV